MTLWFDLITQRSMTPYTTTRRIATFCPIFAGQPTLVPLRLTAREVDLSPGILIGSGTIQSRRIQSASPYRLHVSRRAVKNEIAQMVSQKFNLSPDVSQQLVDFIVTQVKGTLPRAFRSMFDGLLAGGTEAEGIMYKLKDLPAASCARRSHS